MCSHRSQVRTSLAMLASLFAVSASPSLRGQGNEDDFMTGDSAFVAAASITVNSVDDAARKGWQEEKVSLRFGAFGLNVTQRLDPATGFPPLKRQWGDALVGISGKKPAFYMAGNWSPWYFLDAEVRLDGDDGPVPSPTMSGRLIHAGLCEAGEQRVVAEAIWHDTADGFLLARFFGWRGDPDRFGMALAYSPPPGRQIRSLAYVLTCQPYDLADRGHWERQRWLATAPDALSALSSTQPVELTAGDPLRFVFFNRFAHNNAGTNLAVAPDNLAAVSIRGHGRDLAASSDRTTVRITLRPHDPATAIHVVLGDWVHEAYTIAIDKFFAAESAIAAELADMSNYTPPAPSPPPRFRSLPEDPALTAEFAPRLAEAELEYSAAREAWIESPDIPALARLQVSRRALSELHRQIREAWVTEKLFQ